MVNVERIVFLSLVLDLFAFTIPLPLFPRIIEWYTLRESSNPNGFLSLTLRAVSAFRSLFYKTKSYPKRWDIILLGGLMGSLFSTLQFLVSPIIGSLSDKYGRKRILLLTMIGNILSAIIWIQSTTFASYVLSRIVGGLSEGNVQLAVAIISDVSTPERRSKALAQVGIAFAICFCIGPPIGAYFASKPLPRSMNIEGIEFNVYAVPALLTLILLVLETVCLIFALPETRWMQKTYKKPESEKATEHNPQEDYGQSLGPVRSVEERISLLTTLRSLHFFFLAAFSGMEFTFTFLTYDLLDWSNSQNGKLIGSIGIVSALLQGGYVRRSMSHVGEANMARRGVASCTVGLFLLSLLPKYVQSSPSIAIRLLQIAAVCMAFTSATVVNALTAMASLQCGEDQMDKVTGKVIEEHPELVKGKALGKFRSSGQLGRAIGPILACATYWTFGPSVTYATSSAVMVTLYLAMNSIVRIGRIQEPIKLFSKISS